MTGRRIRPVEIHLGTGLEQDPEGFGGQHHKLSGHDGRTCRDWDCHWVALEPGAKSLGGGAAVSVPPAAFSPALPPMWLLAMSTANKRDFKRWVSSALE